MSRRSSPAAFLSAMMICWRMNSRSERIYVTAIGDSPLKGLKVQQTQYGKPPGCIRTMVRDQRASVGRWSQTLVLNLVGEAQWRGKIGRDVRTHHATWIRTKRRC